LPSGTRINATLEGAFLKEALELPFNKRNPDRRLSKAEEKEKENYLTIYLRSDSIPNLTQNKTYAIHRPDKIDLMNASRIPIMFDIGEDNLELLQENEELIQMIIQSNFTACL